MATHEEVIQRWMIEAGREKPHFLHRSDGNLFVTKNEGIMYYDREGRGQWGRGQPARNIRLARFIGDRYGGGVCLLNGDGFVDNLATEWQTRIRTQAQAHFGWERVAIIPFEALDGASINYDTIKSIEVTQDTNDTEVRPVNLGLDLHLCTPTALSAANFRRTDRYQSDPQYHTQTWEGTFRNHRLQITVVHSGRNSGAGSYSADAAWGIYSASVWAQPEFGQFEWQRLQRVHSLDPPERNQRTGDPIYRWQWIENIHRLGSVVFSAHGLDERRHRWLSAFDMQEPGGLYFLAQCPDQGKIKSYQDAIDALAPPIVKQARESGRQVYRQGDVFAVEISWDDEMIYDNAIMRVRRDVVLQDLERRLANGNRPIPAGEGEMEEVGTCPFCTGKHKFGTGPKARRALMIHSTAHTAEEVVIKKNGVTYIKGILHHDPVLEDPTRQPEHTLVRLQHSEGNHGWFLAVRNTVPRLRAPRAVTQPSDATAAGARRNATVTHERMRERERAAA